MFSDFQESNGIAQFGDTNLKTTVDNILNKLEKVSS